MSFGSYKGDTNVLEIVFVDLYNCELIHNVDIQRPCRGCHILTIKIKNDVAMLCLFGG